MTENIRISTEMNLSSVCRCCLAEGCYKQLSSEYFHAGQNEVYSKMLQDTFNLTLTDQMQLKQLICDPCITKLRDATAFKTMVLATEETLMRMLNLDPDPSSKPPPELKVESDDYVDDFEDRLDDTFNDDFDWNGDDKIQQEKGQIFVIKMEPKEEPAPTAKRKTKVAKKQTSGKKEKKSNKATSASGGMTLAKIAAKSKDRQRERDKASESHAASRENTLKLILNSNLCLFKSLKTKFGCFYCKESFLTMPELREHSKTHSNTRTLQVRINCLKGMSYRNVDISSLSCKLCDQRCVNLNDLKSHLTDSHKMPFGDGEHFLIPYNLENGFKCVLCDQSFNTYTRMSIHMNTHYANNVCEICGCSYINRLSLRMHVNAVHREKKCSLCPLTFVSHYLRARHMRLAHGSRGHRRHCALCGDTFRYEYLLLEHRIQEHGVKRQISECPECGKTFLSPQNLKIHIRSVHIRERNYPCAVCGMRFFTKCDQKRHSRTHEDVRSYSCGFCSGRFKAKDSWRRHLRRQHPQQL